MLNYIFISIITILISSNSNTNLPIDYQLKYKVTFEKNNETLVNDICQLDITKSQSYFYSLGFKEEIKKLLNIYDISKSTKSQISLKASDFRRDLYGFNTLKNYKTQEAIISERVGSQLLGYVKDSLSFKRWNITNEKKKIGNLECIKAETTKDGAKIIAWFCKDIPLNEGPFYHYGLPGLIVQTSSSLGWKSSLISIVKPKIPNQTLEVLPFVLVNNVQLSKARKNAEWANKNGVLPSGSKIEKVEN